MLQPPHPPHHSLVPCRMNEEIRKLFSNLGSTRRSSWEGTRDSWVFLGAQDLQSKSPFEQVSSWQPPCPRRGMGVQGMMPGMERQWLGWLGEENTGQCERATQLLFTPENQGVPTGSFSSRKQPHPLLRRWVS